MFIYLFDKETNILNSLASSTTQHLNCHTIDMLEINV